MTPCSVAGGGCGEEDHEQGSNQVCLTGNRRSTRVPFTLVAYGCCFGTVTRAAENAGLVAGQVLLTVNHVAVEGAEHAQGILSSTFGNKGPAVELQVWAPPDDFVFSGGANPEETDVAFDGLVNEAMNLAADEKKHLKRVCCALQGGDTARGNLPKLCQAIGVSPRGDATKWNRAAIEVKLRQLQFGADVDFIPTAYHMTLSADEFYTATRIRDLGDGYSEYLSRSISETCRLLREFVGRRRSRLT